MDDLDRGLGEWSFVNKNYRHLKSAAALWPYAPFPLYSKAFGYATEHVTFVICLFFFSTFLFSPFAEVFTLFLVTLRVVQYDVAFQRAPVLLWMSVWIYMALLLDVTQAVCVIVHLCSIEPTLSYPFQDRLVFSFMSHLSTFSTP